MDVIDILNKKLNEFSFDEDTIFRLNTYIKLLASHNHKVNLTSISQPEDFVVKHILDSLSALDLIPASGHVLDIGSGGGLPAIPLAIARPNTCFFLVEATLKKAEFLRYATKELGLKNTTVIDKRCEDLAGLSDYRQKMDIVTSRALAPLNILVELAVPFLKVGGCLVAYKGARAFEEIKQAKNALHLLGAEVKKTHSFFLDGLYQRSLVEIQNLQETDKAYPRAYKKIKTKPL